MQTPRAGTPPALLMQLVKKSIRPRASVGMYFDTPRVCAAFRIHRVSSMGGNTCLIIALDVSALCSRRIVAFVSRISENISFVRESRFNRSRADSVLCALYESKL